MTISKSIHVERPVDHAFRLFTDEIGKWWPLKQCRAGLTGVDSQICPSQLQTVRGPEKLASRPHVIPLPI